MSSFLGNAEKKAQDTVKEGEHVIQDCVDKGIAVGKEVGQQVIDKGCQAAQNTCDQVSGPFKGTGSWTK